MQPIMLVLMCLAVLCSTVPVQSGWNEFSSAEGRFSASLPADVKTNTIATDTSEGRLLTHTVSATDRDLNEYLVSWTQYPESSIEQKGTEETFKKMRDALVQFKSGKVLSEAPVVHAGYPAKAVTFATSEGRTVTVRFYFVKNRFYQVMAETGKVESAAVAKFFASFKILPGTPV